jgi:hypothetical protein
MMGGESDQLKTNRHVVHITHFIYSLGTRSHQNLGGFRWLPYRSINTVHMAASRYLTYNRSHNW